MDTDETGHLYYLKEEQQEEPLSPINNTILQYLKNIGRKRNVEQYFSLSTAESEVRDPLFWRRMKDQTDSADSDKSQSESSKELCRISIRCSVPDTESTSLEDTSKKDKLGDLPESPPIISDEIELLNTSRHSNADVDKSDLNTSQKSIDTGVDSSTNKQFSPTNSITSQKKLEWDSLADIGYSNENDRKNSATSLSTLERMALHQQYSNSDNTKSETGLGLPTAQSTPVEETKEVKLKMKSSKLHPPKNTKFHKKDIDFVTVPSLDNMQSLHVNLTKHLSFNIDKHSGVITQNVSDRPNNTKNSGSGMSGEQRIDKEIQTSLTKKAQVGVQSHFPTNESPSQKFHSQDIPVIIKLRNRVSSRKIRSSKRSYRKRKRIFKNQKQSNMSHDKSGEQVSEAESFEYMPGHIYNQNKLVDTEKSKNVLTNKSSLESSEGVNTGSSKTSTKSFTNELEKGIELLNKVMQQHQDNSNLKKKLVKDLVLKLINSKYRGDDSITEFLSGLTHSSSVVLGQSDYNSYTTTSTSDANNSGNTSKYNRPKKSILRVSKSVSEVEMAQEDTSKNLQHFDQNSDNQKTYFCSNSETEATSKDRNSSAEAITSSEELYKKYLYALQKEQTYRRQLIDKQNFWKRKLLGSNTSVKSAPTKIQKLNELINDLTRNNYDDGSGDASKLESGSMFSLNDHNKYGSMRKLRSHSVFTLSSCNSNKKSPGKESKKINFKPCLQDKRKLQSSPKPSTSKDIDCQDCGCPYSTNKVGLVDSAVQVNVCNNDNNSRIPPFQTDETENSPMEPLLKGMAGKIKYVCFCAEDCECISDNVLIYKCSRIADSNAQSPCNNLHVPQLQICGQTDSNKLSRTCLSPRTEPQSNLKSKLSQTDLSVNLNLNKIKTNINMKTTQYSDESDTSGDAPIQTCMQTDISINPKISDPSISDVNFIEGTCESKKVKQKNDHRNTVTQFPPETNQYKKINTCEDKLNQEQNVGNNFVLCKKVEKVIEEEYTPKTEDIACQAQSGPNRPSCHIATGVDKQTFPLAGTNMALTINNDDCENKCGCKIKQSQGVATDRSNFKEKSTSLRDECSKAVQSEVFKITSSSSDTNIHGRSRVVFPNSTNSLNGRSKINNNKNNVRMENERIGNKSSNSSEKRTSTTGAIKNVLCKKPNQTIKKDIPDTVNNSKPVKSCCNNNDKLKYKTFPLRSSPVSARKSLDRRNTYDTVLPSTSTEHEDKSTDGSKNADYTFGTGGTESLNKCCAPKIPKKQIADNSNNIRTQNSRVTQRSDGLFRNEYDIDRQDIGNKYYVPNNPMKQNAEIFNSNRKEVNPMTENIDGHYGDIRKANYGTGREENENKRAPKIPMKQDNLNNNMRQHSNLTHRSDALFRNEYDIIDGQNMENKCCASKNPKKQDADTFKTIKREISPMTENLDGRYGNIGTDGTGRDKNENECCVPKIPMEQVVENLNNVRTQRTSVTRRSDGIFRGEYDIINSEEVENPCCASKNPNKQDADTFRSIRREVSPRTENLDGRYGDIVNCDTGREKNENKFCVPKIPMEQVVNNLNNIRTQRKSVTQKSDGVFHDEYDLDRQDIENTCCAPKNPRKQDADNLKNIRRERGSTSEKSDIHDVNCDRDSEENYKCCASSTCLSNKQFADNLNNNNIRQHGSNVTQRFDDRFGHQNAKYVVGRQEIDNKSGPAKSPKTQGIKKRNSSGTENSDERVGHDQNNGGFKSRCAEKSHQYKSYDIQKSGGECCDKTSNGSYSTSASNSDPILDLIKDITKRYTKNEVDKSKRKKCYKNIMTLLNYLVDTDDSTLSDYRKHEDSCTSCDCAMRKRKDCSHKSDKIKSPRKKLVDKGVQPDKKKSSTTAEDSSDILCSSNLQGTSTDSAACRLLNKIKNECEKYNQRKCKSKKHISSSTSITCDKCKKSYESPCKVHRCKKQKSSKTEKAKKNCIAYNLIIQTSDSVVSEENIIYKNRHPLRNIIVKVPSKRKNMTVAQGEYNFERRKSNMATSPHRPKRPGRSRSLPNDSDSAEEALRQSQQYSVRQYLEKNRPDFVEKYSERQDYLKKINEIRANERDEQRKLLSLRLASEKSLNSVSLTDLRQFADFLGINPDTKKKGGIPKFIREKEMKQHSEKIYKTLPEVVQKKEELKKDRIKKTNLIMASLFNKNLQKHTLRGSVNLSNYNKVIKI